MEPTYNHKLHQAIKEKMGTQRNFARTVKYHESYISDVVAGKRVLPKLAQNIWATCLGKSRAELFARGVKTDG